MPFDWGRVEWTNEGVTVLKRSTNEIRIIVKILLKIAGRKDPMKLNYKLDRHEEALFTSYRYVNKRGKTFIPLALVIVFSLVVLVGSQHGKENLEFAVAQQQRSM